MTTSAKVTSPATPDATDKGSMSSSCPCSYIECCKDILSTWGADHHGYI
jgi:hypothetical protein